jgi:hypothetical protein
MLLLRRSVAGPLPQPCVRPCALTPLRFPPAERKAKLRQALTETKKEIDEYRAQREVKLRATNPEVRPGAAVPCVCSAVCVLRHCTRALSRLRTPQQAQALDARVARVTAETDRSIAALECVAWGGLARRCEGKLCALRHGGAWLCWGVRRHSIARAWA